jgi:hypothetical protein
MYPEHEQVRFGRVESGHDLVAHLIEHIAARGGPLGDDHQIFVVVGHFVLEFLIFGLVTLADVVDIVIHLLHGIAKPNNLHKKYCAFLPLFVEQLQGFRRISIA